jgi:hypothetical protein
MRPRHALILTGLMIATLPGAPVAATEPGAGGPDAMATHDVPELLRARGYRMAGPVTTRGRVFVVEGDSPSGYRMLFVIDPQTRDIAGQKPLRRR